MTKLTILAAFLAAGAAQAVAPVANAPAAKPAQTAAQAPAPKRFPGVSDAGNAVLGKLQTTPDPQLQALVRTAKAAHDTLLSVVMAPTVDVEKAEVALKAQDDALNAIRAHNTERVILAAKQLPDEDKGTFLRTLVLSQTQRPATAGQAPATPKP